jgi:hypothetical protein
MCLWVVASDVSKDHCAFIFKSKHLKIDCFDCLFWETKDIRLFEMSKNTHPKTHSSIPDYIYLSHTDRRTLTFH